jgi:hypothetical protein
MKKHVFLGILFFKSQKRTFINVLFSFSTEGLSKINFFQLFIKIIISPKLLLYDFYYLYRILNNISIFFYFIQKKTKKNSKKIAKIQFIPLFMDISKFKHKNGDFRGMIFLIKARKYVNCANICTLYFKRVIIRSNRPFFIRKRFIRRRRDRNHYRDIS